MSNPRRSVATDTRVILICSGKGGVGKTTLTANLGISLARQGLTTAVLDADFGLRNLDLLLGLENRIVYTAQEVLEEECRLDQALVKHKQESNLSLLPAGNPRMLDWLKPDDMKRIVDMLKEQFNYVLIDCPAGVEDGMQLKVSGKGNAAPFEGVNGDLIVLITINNHDKLVREGQNLHYDHYISFADAALGTSCEIPTVTGKVKIKLEEGIQSSKILRLKGKGLPSVNNYGHGDLLVHINVWTPQKLSKEEKTFFESSKRSDSFTPNPTVKDKSFFDRVKEMFG